MVEREERSDVGHNGINEGSIFFFKKKTKKKIGGKSWGSEVYPSDWRFYGEAGCRFHKNFNPPPPPGIASLGCVLACLPGRVCGEAWCRLHKNFSPTPPQRRAA